MKQTELFTILGALLVGAGAMYYLDPEQGRRRRAMVVERVDSASRETRGYLESRRKRSADKVRGMLARMRGRLAAQQPPDDQQLEGHVRSRLGRAVSYPHAIETRVEHGRVAFRGDILARELNILMAETWAIPGIIAIDNHLSLHDEPGNVPRLQGRPHRRGRVRALHLAGSVAPALALAGSLGAGLGALRAQGAAKSNLFSVAVALFAYGMGDGARRLMRQRRGMQQGPQAVETAGARAHKSQERTGATTTMPLNPSSMRH
ncbi:MAG: hypothetical protein HGA47_10095 [Zoogloea sp.]|nr:hypothetical protein [Zoogloea sp.]